MLRSAVKFLFAVLILLPSFVKGQVTANFTIDDTAGCAPMVVHFTNTSTGATSYSWNLGNGTLSSLTDVSGAYLTPGTYTITLVASNGTSTSTRSMTIRAYALPTVNFTAADTTICPGGSVSFSSSVSSGAWGAVKYNWNFGDGLTSTLSSPSHTYALPGNYNVTLFATNVKGCINSRSKMPYVIAYTPPSPGFTVSNNLFCHPPGAAAFTNTTVGTGPMTYFWRFGDGGTSVLPNPTRNYTSPGLFSVSLKATDANGCIDSTTYPDFITVGSMTASFTAPAYSCPYLPITFTNTSSTHLTSYWDFGDTTISPDENPEHTYSAVGTYTVTLVVYDGLCFDTVRRTINIVQPSGSFTISPARPCDPPRVLTFNASVPSGCTVSWNSMIRGPLGTGTTVSHNFPLIVFPGMPVPDTMGFIDSVTMFITDSHGCKDTVGRRDTVNYLEVYIYGGPHMGCTPLTDTLIPTILSHVYNPFCYGPWYECGYPPPMVPSVAFGYPYSIASYSWDFGDGSPLSSVPIPYHTYTLVGGVYWPQLTVTTSNGCSASSRYSYTQPVRVGSPPPTPTFTITPTRACAGRPIRFAATGLGTFDEYAWDYGDGNSDSLATTTHVYTVPGIFTVDLRTKYNGCPSLLAVKRDTIDSANAISHYEFYCIPRTKIAFRDLSSGDDVRLWQFGDGSTSTAFHPVHTYSAIGVYPVTLTTYNFASGCRDTMNTTVDLRKLVAFLTVSDTTICKGVKDTFSVDEINKPQHDSSWIVKYNWFVDGVATDSLLSTYQHDTTYYVFNIPGPHTVMAVLLDNHGCFDTLIKNIMVARPVDTFDFTPVTGCAPLLVNFTDRSTNTAGVGMASYFWKFGDGKTATTTSPGVTHVYTANGIYTVKEVITDVFGCKDSLTKRTRVTANKPRAAFNASVTTVCARRSLRFTNTTTGTFTCLWFFGDGDTSTAISPVHSYNAAGIYSVTLIVISPAGCRDTLTETNYITVKGLPSPSFTMDDSFSVCSPFTVNFSNTSTGATSYFWTFGDGTSSVVPSPSTVYLTPGYYRVKLLAINSFSCTDTAIKHVTLFGYTGAFTYTPRYGCKPLSVAFTATVSAIASAVWDFSDGVTTPPSLSVSATHVYSATGAYVPKLILTDSAGCTSASLGADTIKIDNITADFTTTPSPGCVNSPMTFNDTSTHMAPVTNWLWTLAPGYTSTARAPVYTYTASGTHPVTLLVTDLWGCTATVTKNVTVNTVPASIGGPSVVCVGTSATLTNTVTGGLWSSSSTSIATVGSVSGIVNGVATGTAIISYSLGSGCLATKVVTVNAPMSPIVGSSTVCVNGTTAHTNATAGGVWSSSSTIVCTIGSVSGIVTGIGAGNATISYTLAGCTVTKSITVNPLPSPITGNAPVCVSRSVTLNSTPSSGTWSSGSPAIASVGVTGGVVLGVAAGSAGITYTLTTGCKATTTVTVNNPPSTITGSGFVCVGGSTPLNSVTPGGIWSSSNISIVTVGSVTGVMTGMALGTAVISYTAGGCATVKTVSVIPLPAAIMGVNAVCIGQTTTLTHATGGGIWSSASTSIAVVGTSGVVSGMLMGVTTITYSLGGGCTVTIPLTVNPLPASVLGSNSLCVGASTTLTNPFAGGVWSSASPGTSSIDSVSGVVTGISGGSTLISYTISTGCVRTFPVTVNVVPPILGIRDMCAWEDTIYISNSNPFGSYSSTGVLVASLGGGAGRVVAMAPGIATVTYSLTIGCTLTDTITVNPPPPLITGTTSICQGTATTLANAAAGGRWSSSDSMVAPIDSISGYVNGVSGGNVRITYTVIATGCKTDTPFVVTPIPYTGTITGPSNLCVGQTITLVDSFSGGVWSASNGSATVSGGNVTGVYPGVDTITYRITNACGTSSATHIVTVVQMPNAGSITGPAVVCVGDTIQLINPATGGVWSNLNNKSMVTVSGLVIGINAGIDTIIYTVTNMCGVDRAKHGVLINPLPDAGLLTGSSAVCLGDTITIASTVTGGILGISNANAILNGWSVRGVKTGFDTLSYSVTNSCGTAAVLKQIIIDSLPYAGTITGGHGLCIGDSLALNASEPGGTWSESGNAISIYGSVTVKGIAAGTDMVSYSISNNCGTSVVTQSITINPLPEGLAISRNGYTLSVPSGYAAYQWTLNGANIPGATNNTYVFTGAGSYGVTVTNGFGCLFTYSDYKISDCTIEDIQVFPNPTVGKVTIQWCKKVSARINAIDGKLITEVMNTNEVNLAELPNGVYSITIFDLQNNKLLTKRITLLR
ncbi:MAG: hypothetical protein K0Q79_359 [Flavipsychrobacter sp.]|jgi:PKD repeat protein|nr:hypothetical protein [Flavipsychrobacter sp.]